MLATLSWGKRLLGSNNQELATLSWGLRLFDSNIPLPLSRALSLEPFYCVLQVFIGLLPSRLRATTFRQMLPGLLLTSY